LVPGFDLTDLTSESESGHELVVGFRDRETRVSGIVAIHSTALGPALSGIRARTYSSGQQALSDALLLSEAMTLKASAAGLNVGGGEVVIELEGQSRPGVDQWERFGELFNSFDGKIVGFADAGVGQGDLETIARQTPHIVADTSGLGDPAMWVALGVKAAMEGALVAIDGAVDWNARSVVVIGVGKVGGNLARLLAAVEAQVKVADIDIEAAKELAVLPGIEVVDIDWAHEVNCDILAPCAMGGYIDERVVSAAGARMVVGAASNQLASENLALALADRGIVYVPDFIANAGGLMCVDAVRQQLEVDIMHERMVGLGRSVHLLVETSLNQSDTPLELAAGQARTRVVAGALE